MPKTNQHTPVVAAGELPKSLLNTADFIADRGAACGRAGREFNAFQIVAILDTEDVKAEDLSFLAWSAHLGYREGCEASRC